MIDVEFGPFLDRGNVLRLGNPKILFVILVDQPAELVDHHAELAVNLAVFGCPLPGVQGGASRGGAIVPVMTV